MFFFFLFNISVYGKRVYGKQGFRIPVMRALRLKRVYSASSFSPVLLPLRDGY